MAGSGNCGLNENYIGPGFFGDLCQPLGSGWNKRDGAGSSGAFYSLDALADKLIFYGL